MDNTPKKEPVEQIVLLNEFLEQGNPIVSKGLPKQQVMLNGLVENLNNLSGNSQNSTQSLTKAFEAMNELNKRIEETRTASVTKKAPKA